MQTFRKGGVGLGTLRAPTETPLPGNVVSDPEDLSAELLHGTEFKIQNPRESHQLRPQSILLNSIDLKLTSR